MGIRSAAKAALYDLLTAQLPDVHVTYGKRTSRRRDASIAVCDVTSLDGREPSALGRDRPIDDTFEIALELSVVRNGTGADLRQVTEAVDDLLDQADVILRSLPDMDLGQAAVMWAYVAGDIDGPTEVSASDTRGPVEVTITAPVRIKARFRLT